MLHLNPDGVQLLSECNETYHQADVTSRFISMVEKYATY